jgi:hypothetical protein
MLAILQGRGHARSEVANIHVKVLRTTLDRKIDLGLQLVPGLQAAEGFLRPNHEPGIGQDVFIRNSGH